MYYVNWTAHFLTLDIALFQSTTLLHHYEGEA